MSERELHRAIARTTGESVERIQGLGFRLLDDPDPAEDLGPLVIDWDIPRPAYLTDVLADDNGFEPSEPLPTYDEEWFLVAEEDPACAAA